MFKSLFVMSVILFIVSPSFVECSDVCRVKSMVCFEWFIRLFCLIQLNMSCRHGCSFCFTVIIFVRIENCAVICIYEINKSYAVSWCC